MVQYLVEYVCLVLAVSSSERGTELNYKAESPICHRPDIDLKLVTGINEEVNKTLMAKQLRIVNNNNIQCPMPNTT